MTVQPQAPPQLLAARGISLLLHGAPKAGKTTLANTVPAPRLVLDAESGSFWAPGRKIAWDPRREPVPYWDGSWDTCMVTVHDISTVSAAYDQLRTGRHPFNGLVMDSLTEIQQRMMDSLAGTKQMSRDHWGALLRQVNAMIRQFRDLITHPVRPLWGICYICGTHQRDGKWRPLLQGGGQDFVPYYVDVLGYLAAMADGTRQLLIGPHPQFETGERLHGRLPYSMLIGDGTHPGYTIETMLQQVNAR